jgi:hypothetical protein
MATIREQLLLDFAAVLNDPFGPAVTIDLGYETIRGIFEEQPKLLEENGQSIWSDTPTLLVLPAVAAEVTLNSTELEIGEILYQAFDRSVTNGGPVTLYLTRDF